MLQPSRLASSGRSEIPLKPQPEQRHALHRPRHSMNKPPRPTPERIRECFSYDERTGKITRLISTRNAKAGSDASKNEARGYFNTSVDGHILGSHVVAWVIKTGEYPVLQIDHINGNRKDNRWCNLRQVTRSQNLQNSKRRLDNSSGVKGVNWHKKCQKWNARLCLNGHSINLGFFTELEDAKAARINAANRIYKEYARHE